MIPKARITENLNNCLENTDFISAGEKKRGKVRDQIILDDKIILITTDRQSAFDRILATVPFKGQVLNQVSAWWFENTRDIVDNHVIAVPDPNVTVAKKCTVFPIEFVMRGYLTGSSSTSAWTQYKRGIRNICGNRIPDGMKKNEKFETPILTPTTKDESHDVNISAGEIISQGIIDEETWNRLSNIAFKLFQRGREIAAEHGLILVDTKYELGTDTEGNIVLLDEIHTPDSSRYWCADSYEERLVRGEEPKNIDKEFLRLWFQDNCDPYADEVLPEAPAELLTELSTRYITLYEMITGKEFVVDARQDIQQRIAKNISKYLK
ncbi:MAG: phosphoribosylaminoimidazolesuccinocarboxamide synthase [Fibrobacterota bacterium]